MQQQNLIRPHLAVLHRLAETKKPYCVVLETAMKKRFYLAVIEKPILTEITIILRNRYLMFQPISTQPTQLHPQE
jgi:hypothetical protein